MTQDVITVAEWRKLGVELFGKDSSKWLFVCPICETPQSITDFLNAGVDEKTARESIAIECIGRSLPKASQEAISEKKVVKGKPCNYAGYGLFKLNPISVKEEDGYIFKIFDFYKEN